MMENKAATIVIASLVLLTSGEEIFENSSHLCSKCTCDSFNNNRTLNLSCVNKQMEHTVANWPWQAEDLVASFSHNNITTLEKMPGSAGSLKLLFDHCGIRYLDTGLFESTINVKFVDLSHNLLTSDQLGADVFKGPYNATKYQPIGLEYLNLGFNDIHSLQKNVFEHIPKLKVLSLEGNALIVIDQVTSLALSTLSNLESLNLANNRLTQLPKYAVMQLYKLTDINLSNNDLDFVPSSLGYVATTLQTLRVDNNPIIELTTDDFMGMENLLELYANNLPELQWIKTKTFFPLLKLQKLELTHNFKLYEIDETAFGGNDRLREVYLNDNSLRILQHKLLPWSQLRVLDIRGNQISCYCDLYNITGELSDEIKRDKDGPFCVDSRTARNFEIYTLTSDVCVEKPMAVGRRTLGSINSDFKVMRMTMVTLAVVTIVATIIIVVLGYSKWKHYMRSRGYPYPSQIIYNPVATSELRF